MEIPRRAFVAGTVLAAAGCSNVDEGGEPQATPTDTENSDPAEFELVEYDAPDTVEIGEEFSLSITIRNVGGRAGTYRERIYFRTGDSDWREGTEWNFGEVPAEETATAELVEPASIDVATAVTYRLGDFDQTATIRVTPAQLPWGETATTPSNFLVSVEEPNLQDSYRTDAYGGGTSPVRPDNGGQWAFATITVENQGENAARSPLSLDFPMLIDNQQFDPTTTLLQDPVTRDQPFEGGQLLAGVRRSGWIAYEIPGSATLADIQIVYSDALGYGNYVAYWGSG